MQRQLLRDSATYISGSIIMQVLGFTGLLLLMNYLPVAEYGKYIYIIEFISIFAFFADGGFTQLVVRETSQNSTDVKVIYSRAQSAQVLISAFMLALIVLISYPLNSPEDFCFLLIYGLSVVITAYFSPMLAILVASGRKDLIFYKDVTLALAKLLFMTLGILLEQSIIYFIFLGFLNCIVLFLLYLYTRLKKEFTYFFRTKTDISGSLGFMKQGLLFTTLMTANVIYNKIDIIMLEKMVGSAEVGYYSGATRFIYPFMFISTAFMTAVFPTLAKYAQDKESFNKIQYTALYYLGGIGIILSTGLFLSADLIFNIFFDDKYDASIPVFKVLVWYLALVFIYGSLSNNLVAKNKVRFLVWLNIVMIGLNIGINFFLIPVHGALGAAIATIICEILILIAASIYYLRGERGEWGMGNGE